jgi:hypothetical protein
MMLQFSSCAGDEAAVSSDTAALAKQDASELPLYGRPVAIKDNIDLVRWQPRLPELRAIATAAFLAATRTEPPPPNA